MDGWRICFAVVLLIAIVIPPQKEMGANGFLKNWDSYIEKPAKRLRPPKFIQIRFNIGNSPINILTYLTFWSELAAWIGCIVLLPFVLLLDDKPLDVLLVGYAILYMVIHLPIGVARTICTLKISKRRKKEGEDHKLYTEEYIAMRDLAEAVARMHSSEHRKMQREQKEYVRVIEPFLKEFEKCLYKKKGIRYITEENLKWAERKILPKYQKKISYVITEDEPQYSLLTIRLIRNNQLIGQIPIKKFKQ